MTQLLTLLAIARLARLAVIDYATRWLRDLAAGVTRDEYGNPTAARRPIVEYLVNCPWCMSMYLGPLVAAPVAWWLTGLTGWAFVVEVGVMTLAGSLTAGFVAQIEDAIDAWTADR